MKTNKKVKTYKLKLLSLLFLFTIKSGFTSALDLHTLANLSFGTKLINLNMPDSIPVFSNPRFENIPVSIPSINPVLAGNRQTLLKNSGYNLLKGGAANFLSRNLIPFLWSSPDSAKNLVEVNSSLYFELYAGKRIASIRFKQLDVFGPTLQDTTLVAKSWVSSAANRIHVKTLESKLRKQLLFSTGQKVDPEVLADNEKIFRDLPYIRDVSILLLPSSKAEDEVNVLILIKERFEYGFQINPEFPRTEVEVYNDNMFGLGHQFNAKIVHHQIKQPNWGGEVNYLFSDFGGKFVNGGVKLINTYKKSGITTFVERKFISSEIKNAGGLTFQRINRDYYNTPYNLTKSDTVQSYLNTDIWLGHSFNVHPGLPTLSGRFFHQNFYWPYSSTNRGLIQNHDFILGSLGFSKRNLFKNNLVYGYGITEDIPYGRYFELASGVDFTQTGSRFYTHLLYSRANILTGGRYIGGTVAIGGYLEKKVLEQGVVKLNLNYFSKLIFVNKNPYRNFINFELLSGINRYWDEFLSINRYYGLRDFRSLDVRGTSRLKMNLESVHFLNLDYHGFRFAQYFYGDCAFISNSLQNIFKENFYTGIGIGLRVHNESLVFKVIELRLSWFPVVPNDQNILNFMIFTQSKSTFDDFLGRKPQEILYQ